MKAMSIIGIILFSLFIITYLDGDIPPEGSSYEDAFFSGLLGVLFGLAYSIVGLVYVKKHKKNAVVQNYAFEITKLGELKEKGLLTDEEFETKKQQLLTNI